MDTTQLLLTIVLLVTTVLLIVVGVQLIFVLKEVHKVVKRVNTVVDAFERFGASMEHGFSEFIGFTSGIKTLFKVVDIMHNKKNGKSK